MLLNALLKSTKISKVCDISYDQESTPLRIHTSWQVTCLNTASSVLHESWLTRKVQITLVQGRSPRPYWLWALWLQVQNSLTLKELSLLGNCLLMLAYLRHDEGRLGFQRDPMPLSPLRTCVRSLQPKRGPFIVCSYFLGYWHTSSLIILVLSP